MRLRVSGPDDEAFAKAAHHAAYRDVVLRQFGAWEIDRQDRFFADAWAAHPHHMIEVDGDTVRQVIEALETEYPGFRQRIVDADQDRVRADIAVSVDGEVSAEGLRRKVGPDSEVHFLPAMSGGA